MPATTVGVGDTTAPGEDWVLPVGPAEQALIAIATRREVTGKAVRVDMAAGREWTASGSTGGPTNRLDALANRIGNGFHPLGCIDGARILRPRVPRLTSCPRAEPSCDARAAPRRPELRPRHSGRFEGCSRIGR